MNESNSLIAYDFHDISQFTAWSDVCWDVVVRDYETALQARDCVERFKSNYIPFRVRIISNRYESIFVDLVNSPLVRVIHLNPVEFLESHLDVALPPDLKTKAILDIELLEYISEIDELLSADALKLMESSKSITCAVVLACLEISVDIISTSALPIALSHAVSKKSDILDNDYFSRHFLDVASEMLAVAGFSERFIIWFSDSFKLFEESDQAKEFFQFVFCHHLLSRYRPLLREDILRELGLFKQDVPDIHPDFEEFPPVEEWKLIGTISNEFSKIDRVVANRKHHIYNTGQGDARSGTRVRRLVDLSSGLFVAEADHIFDSLDPNSLKTDELAIIRHHFLNTFADLPFHRRYYFDWLDSLYTWTANVELVDRMLDDDHHESSDIIASYFRVLTVQQQASEFLQSSQCPFGSDLINKIASKTERLTLGYHNRYMNWFEETYPKSISWPVKEDAPWAVRHLPLLVRNLVQDGRNVVVLVVDAMRWDVYRVLRGILRRSNFEPVKERVGLSLVPSNTAVSRKAMFVGENFDEMILREESSGWNTSKEGESLARALDLPFLQKQNAGRGVGYGRGALQDLNRLNFDCLVNAFVVSDMDAIWHSVKASPSTVTSMVEDMFKEIVTALESEFAYKESCSLVITADHGVLSDSFSDEEVGIIEFRYDDIIVDEHPRYFVVGELPGGEDKCLRSKAEYEDWIILDDNAEMKRWGLPRKQRFKDRYDYRPVLAWGFSRRLATRSGAHHVHGGISAFENLVPLTEYRLRREKMSEGEVVVKALDSLEPGRTTTISITANTPAELVAPVLTIPELRINSLPIPTICQGETIEVNIYSEVPVREQDAVKFALKDKECPSSEYSGFVEIPVTETKTKKMARRRKLW